MLNHASREISASSQCEVEGPCFLATITSMHTGKRNRVGVIRCAYELQRYLTCARGVRIEGIQMLCPPTLTGRDGWSLEDLVQIISFQGVETKESAVVYRTSSATYKIGSLDLRRKKTGRIWYSEQNLHSHIPQSSNPLLDSSKPQLYASFC